ncbi:protein FAR1-RELATED SEQUENCE 5-like [Spinacia oleracea]|uniref:Protein FAR1-RELATED SEQUENCE 5-like n=1 Tax=Spinacia oleracea TaxID=3562 RepID=A0ABM3QQ30_SPIOL|nr:protein FAR1-RELATED SEQUENCE 5-like [Spinacia oleracea]
MADGFQPPPPLFPPQFQQPTQMFPPQFQPPSFQPRHLQHSPRFLTPPNFQPRHLQHPRFLPPPIFQPRDCHPPPRFQPPARFDNPNQSDLHPPPRFQPPARFDNHYQSDLHPPSRFQPSAQFDNPNQRAFTTLQQVTTETSSGTKENTSETSSATTGETTSAYFSGSKDIWNDLTEDDIRGPLTGYTGTVDELYELYDKHSILLGFSIRKNTLRRDQKTGEIKERYFCCSKEGKRKENTKNTKKEEATVSSESKQKEQSKNARQQNLTRTGCNASIRLKLQKDGKFIVFHHVIEHNHALTRESLQNFERSQRKIDEEKGKVIEGLTLSGITPADSYRYMCNEAGDARVVGHTLVDHMNFTSRLKMKRLEGKDTQAVVNMLIKRGEEDPNFYFRVKVNEANQVISMFWRDGMMQEDYDVYGDVCVFDTTFRTNKYNLVCAPFLGVNNHWSNVMFGCAFIADEKTHTFVWLLETFLDSMGGKAPITIFTDQDQAMANAIEQVFPNTRHRLCLWHLQKNAVSRFGDLKADNTFKDTFKKCLYRCYNEEEFETTWFDMITKYNLQDHDWFTNLYTIKEKWCTALNKDFFSAAILSSQREQITSLTEFFHIFGATVDRWRYQEDQNEYDCGNALPKSDFPMVGMIKHAANVYTLTLFRDFEKEFKYAMGCISNVNYINGNFFGYKVQHESWPEHTAHYVAFDPTTNSIKCTCRNFEESG